MAARSIATATISFGLVTVPIRIYPAVRVSAGLSFHLLHAKDHVRLKQQYICPKDEQVVPRSEMVKGFEYKKGKYVVFTDEELKALDEQATSGIEITEFLPKDAVDPVYYERTYYLGPDKGGEKGYSLLAQAMADVEEVALAKYAARGKSYLVLVRSTGDHLFLQQLYHSDEVRDIHEVPVETRRNTDAEVKLARQLIEQITTDAFHPEKYEDEVRKRIEKLIAEKLKGKDITARTPAEKPPAEVIDLMEALKASLAGKGGGARRATAHAAAARRSAPAEPPRKGARRRSTAARRSPRLAG
ncbi:MAG TPA: Ku protein [Vicinamibacteria bacterium]|jgi:DNA end-binding protein Ku